MPGGFGTPFMATRWRIKELNPMAHSFLCKILLLAALLMQFARARRAAVVVVVAAAGQSAGGYRLGWRFA